MAVILLVDDDIDNRSIYCLLLEHRGHVCHTAEDGSIGLRAAHELRPDLILLDIRMPVMDGWETIRELRRSPITAGIPVIAFTANVLTEDEQRATEAGFDEYIRKPAKPITVALIVERLLDDRKHS